MTVTNTGSPSIHRGNCAEARPIANTPDMVALVRPSAAASTATDCPTQERPRPPSRPPKRDQIDGTDRPCRGALLRRSAAGCCLPRAHHIDGSSLWGDVPASDQTPLASTSLRADLARRRHGRRGRSVAWLCTGPRRRYRTPSEPPAEQCSRSLTARHRHVRAPAGGDHVAPKLIPGSLPEARTVDGPDLRSIRICSNRSGRRHRPDPCPRS
jgi:hypothetical protein